MNPTQPLEQPNVECFLSGEIKAECKSDMDLYRKAEPDFDIGCKRIRIATGYWSVFADNPGKAHLVTDPIDSITETGVMTKSGKNHEVDLIVYATGT